MDMSSDRERNEHVLCDNKAVRPVKITVGHLKIGNGPKLSMKCTTLQNATIMNVYIP